MREERTMITRMIEERKITAEEGLALLEALERGESKPVEVEEIAVAPAPQLNEDGSGQITQRGQGEANWESKHRTFPTEYVEFATDNASIRYRTWDEPFTQVNVTARMDRPDRNFDLSQWLQGAVTQSSDDERYRFSLKTDDLNGRQVDLAVSIQVPQGQAYELFHMSATNGSLDVQQINSETAAFTSNNGNIVIEGMQVEQVNVTTVNGLIHIGGLLAESAVLTTTNGNIIAKGQLEELECRTTNGSVHTDGVIAEKIEVHTQNGNIKANCQFEELACKSQNGKIEILVANSSSESSITAKTHNGHIAIQFPAHSTGVYGELNVNHGRAACRLNGQQLVDKKQGDDADSCQTFRQGDEELTYVEASSHNGSIHVSDEF